MQSADIVHTRPTAGKFDCENDISEHSHEIVSYLLGYDADHIMLLTPNVLQINASQQTSVSGRPNRLDHSQGAQHAHVIGSR